MVSLTFPSRFRDFCMVLSFSSAVVFSSFSFWSSAVPLTPKDVPSIHPLFSGPTRCSFDNHRGLVCTPDSYIPHSYRFPFRVKFWSSAKVLNPARKISATRMTVNSPNPSGERGPPLFPCIKPFGKSSVWTAMRPSYPYSTVMVPDP